MYFCQRFWFCNLFRKQIKRESGEKHKNIKSRTVPATVSLVCLWQIIVVTLKVTEFFFTWEDKQQDASQETCQNQYIELSGEKFEYGFLYLIFTCFLSNTPFRRKKERNGKLKI